MRPRKAQACSFSPHNAHETVRFVISRYCANLGRQSHGKLLLGCCKTPYQQYSNRDPDGALLILHVMSTTTSLGYIMHRVKTRTLATSKVDRSTVPHIFSPAYFLLSDGARSANSTMEHITDNSLEHLATRISYLKAFIDLTNANAAILRSAKPLIDPLISHILDAVYTGLLSFRHHSSCIRSKVYG